MSSGLERNCVTKGRRHIGLSTGLRASGKTAMSAPSGRFGGHPRSGRATGSSQRKTAHNAAVSARASAPAEGVLSSIRPVPLLTGLEPAVLIQQSVYCCKYKIYIIFLKPLDNKFPIWYNKTLSPLEPGEPYLLLIENRIPNNRYVPGAPAGRATWLTSRLKDVRAKDQTVGLLPADAR